MVIRDGAIVDHGRYVWVLVVVGAGGSAIFKLVTLADAVYFSSYHRGSLHQKERSSFIFNHSGLFFSFNWYGMTDE